MKQVPFDPKELEIRGHLKPNRPWMSPTPVFSPVATPRDNYLAFLRGEQHLWMPSFWDQKSFNPRMLADNVAKGFVSDELPFDPMTEGGGPDYFGVNWVFDGKGSMVVPGNPKVKDITRWEDYITFPDLDALDWEGCSRANRERLRDGRMTQMAIYTGYLERLMSLLDVEGALIALVDEDEQEGVHRFFARLTDFYCDLVHRYRKWFDCDFIWFHDDWGTQRAPFCAPDTYREMIAPYLKRVVDAVHAEGMFFELHSCGKNEALVPIMIHCGVDMWHGQGMNDKPMLYREYGSQIKLGVSPVGREHLDPNRPPMTEDEARQAVRDLLQTYDHGNVFLGMFMGYPPNMNVILYEESRKFFLEHNVSP